MRNRPGLWVAGWMILLLPGCAYLNKPLNQPDVAISQRKVNHTRSEMTPAPQSGDRNNDGYFVGLALSGGGSRSANFSAACMFELEHLGILDKVDCISAVSGGSLPGAYYCLTETGWNPANLQTRLSHPFATDVILTVIQPWNLLVLGFTPWDRSDILASSFRQHLFNVNGIQPTFANLREDRPRLLINCTDLQSGNKFVFCNESFDALNSDLAQYPIAHAVAASAAVPVLLHHVTLRDYSTIFYRYKHILDGGIHDNLGVTSLLESYTSQVHKAAELHQPDPYPKGMVIIVVDAHTDFDTELGDKPDVGLFDSLAAAAGLSTTALLNRVSSATLAELIVQYSPDATTAGTLRQQIDQLEKTGTLVTAERDNKPVRVVHIALSRINKQNDLPFASFGQRVNGIATYFNIEPDEVYHLYKAAELLVHGDTLGKPLEDIAHLLGAGPATQP